MKLTEFAHGGKEYDDKYPEGIPTRIEIELADGRKLDSQFIMFPSGHSKNQSANLQSILDNKFKVLGQLAFGEGPKLNNYISHLNSIQKLSNNDLQLIYSEPITLRTVPVDFIPEGKH